MSHGNKVFNSTAISNNSAGLIFQYSAYDNIFNNGNITGKAYYGEGAAVFYGSYNNVIANSTINGKEGARAVYFYTEEHDGNSTYNKLINNTISNATNLIQLDNLSTNNTFCLNNFTFGLINYINDTSGLNSYNCTTNGKNQGNIYANVIDGSVNIKGNIESSIPGLYIGTTGSGYPYNSSNSLNKIKGNVVDYAPLTPNYQPSCGQINRSITLIESLNISGATCFNITAQNITIDCVGFSITGDNTTNTYGIYTNQHNTTIKNCVISNFSTGLFFNSANSGTIYNSIVSTTHSISINNGFGIYLYSANYNIILNSTVNSTQGHSYLLSNSSYNSLVNLSGIGTTGIYLEAGSDNLIANSNLTIKNYGIVLTQTSNNNFTRVMITSSDVGVSLDSSSNNIMSNIALVANSTGISVSNSNSIITNSNILSTTSNGILIMSGSDLKVSNNQISGNNAIQFYSGEEQTNNDKLFANNTINGLGNSVAVMFMGEFNTLGNNNNRFINNTILNATTLIYFDVSAPAYGNIFCLNNFSNADAFYVDDEGTNYYNCTFDGKNQGNIWENVINGSVNIKGNIESSITGLYIGTTGSGYPYNTISSLNKVTENVIDYAPLTLNYQQFCGQINESITLTESLNISEATCFNITAQNITIDCAGFSITGDNTTNTYGIYTNQQNTTIKNCIISNFSEGIIYSSATDGQIINNTITTQYFEGNGIRITNGADRNNITQNTITSGNANGIYIDGGSNTTIDCQDKLISVINNTNSSYGIYSSQSYATIKNCRIAEFDYDIFLNSSSWNILYNNTIYTSAYRSDPILGISSAVLLINNSNYNIINACNISSTYSNGFFVYLSNNNTIINSSALSVTSYALKIMGLNDDTTSEHNSILGCNGTSINRSGITIEDHARNNFVNNSIGLSTGTRSTSHGIYINNDEENNTLENSLGISQSGMGILIYDRATYVYLINSTGISSQGSGIYVTASDYTYIINCTAESESASYSAITVASTTVNITGGRASNTGGGIGLGLSGHDNTVYDLNVSGSTAVQIGGDSGIVINNIIAHSTDGYGIYYTAYSNIISNSIIISDSGMPLYLNSARNNTIVNNTLISGNTANNLVLLVSASKNNTFYWNNFTQTSGLYINDSNGENNYNKTINGKNQGNIWENVIDGSVNIKGNIKSSITGLYIGTTGSEYPYNSSNSLDKVSTNVIDYAPLTQIYTSLANLTITYTTGGIATGNQTNFYTPETYNINATANAHYTFNNWTITNGNCTIENNTNQNTNTTINNENCNITATFAEVLDNQSEDNNQTHTVSHGGGSSNYYYIANTNISNTSNITTNKTTLNINSSKTNSSSTKADEIQSENTNSSINAHSSTTKYYNTTRNMTAQEREKLLSSLKTSKVVDILSIAIALLSLSLLMWLFLRRKK